MLQLLFTYALGCIALIASVQRLHRHLMVSVVWGLSLLGSHISWLLLDMFDESRGVFQMELHWSWVPTWGIDLSFAVDGYSVWMLCLTVVVTSLTSILSLTWISKGLKEHLLLLYTTQLLLIVCFSALDAFVFLLFFESMLIPMYLWIVVWGAEARGLASRVYLYYALSGSILMTVVFAAMGNILSSFSWTTWVQSPVSFEMQMLYFVAVSLAMMVKLPLFPFHTWLPLAHTQAPSTASIVLASLMLKVAGYGWLRWVLPVVPDAARACAWLMIVLALLSIVWLSLATVVQKDMKRIIAYASVNHMGWVVLGLFVGYLPAGDAHLLTIDSVTIQMFAHGLVSAGLFMAFGMLYHRANRREVHRFGGFASVMPLLSGMFMLLCLANIGVPGSLGFVSEWMMLLGAMSIQPQIAMIAGLGVVGSSAYTLWMYRLVFYGPVRNSGHIKDIHKVDVGILVVLVMMIFGFGFFPRFIIQGVHETSLVMQHHFYRSKIGNDNGNI